MTKCLGLLLTAAPLVLVGTQAHADVKRGSGGIIVQQYDDDGNLLPPRPSSHDLNNHTASSHAPIGVMADHRHSKGEWMVSYRYVRMGMSGNRDGTTSLSPTQIATTVANPAFGNPGQPPTLRVVPVDMDMDMHMIGGMFGLSDRITLTAMMSYLETDMDHITFRGGMGTEILGEFTTRASGIGDTTVGALVSLSETRTHSFHAGLAVSLPTAKLEQTDEILTPMGGRPIVRLPYAMQIGSGTYDLEPALTYSGHDDAISWGMQASAVVRLDTNAQGNKRGDRIAATAWVATDLGRSVSVSARVQGQSEGSIRRRDALIGGPVQTADPDNFGGEQVFVLAGLNYMVTGGALKGHRLAAEYALPIYRDLNGPQLETDSQFTIGWQKAF